MKILQVISHYVPAYRFGGPLQVAHGLGKALVRAGHEVTVCCTNMLDPEATLDVPLDVPVMVEGVKVYYEPVAAIGRYWGFSPAMRRRVRKEAGSADVVFTHFHFQYASWMGGRAARAKRKPLVVFTHGSLNQHGLNSRSRLLKMFYLALFEEPNFRAAHRVAYHSEFELEMSIKRGTPTVVPIGMEPPSSIELPSRGSFRKRHSLCSGRFLFAYMGRLAPGKGLELLIPAFRLVAKEKNSHLLLIGADERGFEARLRVLVNQHGIEDRITFTGLLRGSEKLAALQDADAFVLPSRSEGTSLVTLEAMTMGLPVIVTDRVGLSREVQQSKCGLVIRYDETDLAQALGEMTDRDDRQAMGERGKQCAKDNFNWDKIATNLVAEILPTIYPL